jgi:hypothetical protein
LGITFLLTLVYPTIDFDGQSPLDAAEVNDEGADRMLASEFEPTQTSTAQRIPQAILGVGLTTSKLSCRSNIVAVRALSHIGSLLRSELISN